MSFVAERVAASPKHTVVDTVKAWGGTNMLDIGRQIRDFLPVVGKDNLVSFLRESEEDQEKQLAKMKESRANIGLALVEAREILASEERASDEINAALVGVEIEIAELMGKAEKLRRKKKAKTSRQAD